MEIDQLKKNHREKVSGLKEDLATQRKILQQSREALKLRESDFLRAEGNH